MWGSEMFDSCNKSFKLRPRNFAAHLPTLEPLKTELVSDTGPTYNATVLGLECFRRRGVGDDDMTHPGYSPSQSSAN